jgi:iron(III) transport system ATP-binding protein
MLTVRNLNKTYRLDRSEVRAVRDCSFSLKEGELFTLLGSSGCGKSTTLRCIAGLETPDSGEIVIGGERVFSSAAGASVPTHRRAIGMVFQSYAIWPHMTVFDNVAFPLVRGKGPKRSTEDVRRRVNKALEMVRLAGLENRPTPFLSGGQQQRVALARALVAEPKLLLLDEPLSNLDAFLREEMRTEMKELFASVKITALYVTHDQIEALSMSDRIAVMNQGRIVREGAPKEIYLDPGDSFTAAFIGRTNFIRGELKAHAANGGRLSIVSALGELQTKKLPGIGEGDRILLAWRPEQLKVIGGAEQPANSVKGTVRVLTFIGDALECVVQCGQTELRVKLENSVRLQVGDSVFVHFPPDDCCVIRE